MHTVMQKTDRHIHWRRSSTVHVGWDRQAWETHNHSLSECSCCRQQTSIQCRGTDEHSYIVDGEAVSTADEEEVALVDGWDVEQWSSGSLLTFNKTLRSGAVEHRWCWMNHRQYGSCQNVFGYTEGLALTCHPTTATTAPL